MKAGGFVGLAFLLAMLTVFPSSANAISFKQYKDAKAAGGVLWEKVQIYIAGAGDAYVSANADLQYKSLPLLFCSPAKLGLRMENFIDLLDGFIAKTKIPFNDDSPVTVVLAFGLKDAFPCNK